ncbi:uncharacterized protein DS421_18g625010 [Arachis hypogaea]|nr:uncharacterized protein DS421_18g625010 [Arachis hypogaea]
MEWDDNSSSNSLLNDGSWKRGKGWRGYESCSKLQLAISIHHWAWSGSRYPKPKGKTHTRTQHPTTPLASTFHASSRVREPPSHERRCPIAWLMTNGCGRA